MTVQTHTFLSVGGEQRMLVYDVPASESDANAPVAVLLPALGIQANYYTLLAAALQSRGIRMVLADLPGGETSPARATRKLSWGYPELVDIHAANLIDRVRALFPGAPVYWLAHSLGGHVALMHAGRYRGTVDGVALIASGSPHFKSWRGLGKAKVWVAPTAVGVISTAMGYFPGNRLGFGGREPRALMKQWAKVARRGRFRWRGFDGDAAMQAYRGPLFLVTLKGDSLTPVKSAVALASKTSSIPDRWHWVEDEPLDHNRWPRTPDPVAERLEAWILLQSDEASAGAST